MKPRVQLSELAGSPPAGSSPYAEPSPAAESSLNPLVSRRDFFHRAAQTAGLGAAFLATGRSGMAAERTANPWAYDDSAFRRTDPALIRYREAKRFRSPRPSPRAIALGSQQRLWLGAGKFVTEISLEGAQVSEFSLPGEIRSLAIGPEGSIYAGMRDHVEVYDPKGQRRAVWESPGKKVYLTAIAVSGPDVFLADAGNRVVLRCDPLGKIKSRIGEKNKERNIPGFIVPSPFFDVEVAPDGLLRVTNPGRHRVEAYTFDGDLEFAWGNPGAAIENFCGCCNPTNLALLADGRAVTFEKGIPRVKVYKADGRFEAVVAGTESFADNARVCGPNDCTVGGLDGVVDSAGRIYILDFVAGDVRVMEQLPS